MRRRRADEFSFDVRVPAYEKLIDKVLGTVNVMHIVPPTHQDGSDPATSLPAA